MLLIQFATAMFAPATFPPSRLLNHRARIAMNGKKLRENSFFFGCHAAAQKFNLNHVHDVPKNIFLRRRKLINRSSNVSSADAGRTHMRQGIKINSR
jgi:hypothetical protein